MYKICVLSLLIFNFVAMNASTKQNYYKILGLSTVATVQEINSAYHKLALQYHPDKNKDENAADVFKKINEAHQILSDQDQRENYDELRNNATQSSCHKRSRQESPINEPCESKKAKEEQDPKASCDNHAENVGQKKSKTKVEESIYKEENYFQVRYNKLTGQYELI